ncbi:hypothetical protein [Oerskovia jenensis]|uniref:hypothetical protein n=1 Tax=Oerskovia jenensis TaxID=162169 RepID=UPI0036DAD7E2
MTTRRLEPPATIAPDHSDRTTAASARPIAEEATADAGRATGNAAGASRGDL